MKYTLISLGIILVILYAIFYPNIYFEDKSVLTFNENNTSIPSKIYTNYSTTNYEMSKVYLIYFNSPKEKFYISVAIPPKLIGIPDNTNSIFRFLNILYVPDKSKMFMPINEGPETLIEKYFISDTLITFDTFNDLKAYGKKIIIKRK